MIDRFCMFICSVFVVCCCHCINMYSYTGQISDKSFGGRASGQSGDGSAQVPLPPGTGSSTERSVNYSTLDDALKLLEAEPEPLIDPGTISQQTSNLAEWMDGEKGLSSSKLRSVTKPSYMYN